jgi:hypothetical protein
MARTIRQIKGAMTQQFMADPTIIERYGFPAGSVFEDTFSAVSLESIWFSIVAAAIYVLETLFDAFKEDVDAKIAEAVVASIPWYHKISLAFQYGDSLVFDEKTQGFVYPEIDESKQIVKYAACRDLGGMVYVLASKDNGSGSPTPLSAAELSAFDSFLRQCKPAGVLLQTNSFSPDLVQLGITVQYNPQILTSDGQLIADPGTYPVEDAINDYLHGIVYGGALNKTKLVDAVQAAPGVIDLTLDSVSVKSAEDSSFTPVTGNNYTSVGGSFNSFNLRSGITYVLSL